MKPILKDIRRSGNKTTYYYTITSELKWHDYLYYAFMLSIIIYGVFFG